MNVIIEIPKEFESHFDRDRFKDSLERVKYDIAHTPDTLSGTYEVETISMLIKAFENTKSFSIEAFKEETEEIEDKALTNADRHYENEIKGGSQLSLSYTSEERDLVRSSVSLTALAESLGYTVIRKGGYHSIKEMDSMVIYDDRTWKRWSNKGRINGGSQIDFMLEFGGSGSVPEAVHQLLDFLNSPISAEPSRNMPETDISSSKKHELQLPPKNNDYRRVFAYLMKSRGLSQEVISHFAHNKLIYEDAIHHNVVFCGYDPDGVIRYAGMRGTVTYGNTSFKCDCPGNDKNYGVNIVNKDSSELKVFESVIDCMSYMDLTHDYDSNKLVLGMVADNPLEQFLKDYDHIRDISFCLDNDTAGQSVIYGCAEDNYSGYLEKYSNKGYSCSVEIPPAGKDWNEFLIDHVEKPFKCGQFSADDFINSPSKYEDFSYMVAPDRDYEYHSEQELLDAAVQELNKGPLIRIDVHAGEVHHIDYIKSNNIDEAYEIGREWIEDLFERFPERRCDYDVSAKVSKEVFSDYVPIKDQDGDKRIYFDSHEDAVAFAEHCASVAQFGKIEPSEYVSDKPLIRHR